MTQRKMKQNKEERGKEKCAENVKRETKGEGIQGICKKKRTRRKIKIGWEELMTGEAGKRQTDRQTDRYTKQG